MKCHVCNTSASYILSARKLNTETAALDELGSLYACREHFDAVWDLLKQAHGQEGQRIFVDRVVKPSPETLTGQPPLEIKGLSSLRIEG